jgi:hypothetical protein
MIWRWIMKRSLGGDEHELERICIKRKIQSAASGELAALCHSKIRNFISKKVAKLKKSNTLKQVSQI